MSKKQYIPSVIDLIQIAADLSLKTVPIENESLRYEIVGRDNIRSIRWKINETGIDSIGFYLNNSLVYVCTDFVDIQKSIVHWLR